VADRVAGRTEKAREDDEKLMNKGEDNDRMFEGVRAARAKAETLFKI
jgi:hypothetical protein